MLCHGMVLNIMQCKDRLLMADRQVYSWLCGIYAMWDRHSSDSWSSGSQLQTSAPTESPESRACMPPMSQSPQALAASIPNALQYITHPQQLPNLACLLWSRQALPSLACSKLCCSLPARPLASLPKSAAGRQVRLGLGPHSAGPEVGLALWAGQ